jgi:hypothetical protein
MRSVPFVLGVVFVGLLSYGCGSDDGDADAPSCEELQTQIDACTNISQNGKDSLGPFCATASAACRSCLDGKLCGTTEQCDPACGKK